MQIPWKLYEREVPVNTQKHGNENDEIENMSEYEESEEHFPCISCKEVYDDIEDLIDHYGDTGHNIED